MKPETVASAFNSATLQAVVEELARELVSVEYRSGSSFIRTPLLYPSGGSVVVRVDEHSASSYFVSDMGFGYQEAEFMGASLTYARHARLIAENAGVRFDHHAFFVIQVGRDQLAGAVATIANCSLEATTVAAYKLAERKVADEADRLYQRLITIFEPAAVRRNEEVIGASHTSWPVATIVRSDRGRLTIFEPVTPHHASVASVATKFNDISLLDTPPNRVAVVRNKQEMGTYLAVISQTADVVTRDAPDKTIVRLAAA
jgi:hypothetical protein